MSRRNADQIKEDDIKLMGEMLGTVYYELWQEVAWLHEKWGEYEELYVKKKSRINLMNQTAPLFFRIVQDTLWQNVLLNIARITDPIKSAGKKNLTLQILPSLVKDELHESITSMVKKSVRKAEFCRDWRNRHIAHMDYNLAIE